MSYIIQNRNKALLKKFYIARNHRYFYRWFPQVIRLRFERRTHSLEGCCSIQLSYRTIFFKSVAKVRQFIENSNNLPKFFIRKLRQNLSNSLKWAIYEHLTSIEVMIWQQSQFLQHADVCCQTALLCCKVTIAARNNNRLLE